ncbi:MAG: class I SAM-dependent methyltransferase [Candidatus Cloacimonetes bacterium]|nr:class I SAM-dependent methyltransferase [Candidatus Cloacimonadota bacterium]
MSKKDVFEKYYKEYDEWFTVNKHLYLAELNIIKKVIPPQKNGMEIGIGTGMFAEPLGIKIGVEPATKMAEISRRKGIEVHNGTAENLPFDNGIFDFALMVTTICFVDDVFQSLSEAYRVLKDKGQIIIGFVDKESKIGKQYQAEKEKSKFYKNATFFSTEEILDFLEQSSFNNFEIMQTLIEEEGIMNTSKILNGYGLGSFVVIKASKKEKK